MKTFGRIIVFFMVFLITTQVAFSYGLPARVVYYQRMNYDVFKDNIYGYETSIKEIKKVIDQEKLTDYYILVGDSVAYGTPCPPEQTISSYMNAISKENGSEIRVFNLALPSTMFGDLYTMILMLNDQGISTKHLIVDFSYWELFPKNPTYWFKNELKELDPSSYEKMVAEEKIQQGTLWKNIRANIFKFSNENIAVLGYANFVTSKIETVSDRILREPKQGLAPWDQKPELIAAMKKPDSSWYYSDDAYNMSDSNAQYYFLNKIIDYQKDYNTTFVLNAMNDALLAGETDKKGFKANLKTLETFFSQEKLDFINFNHKVDYDYFSDHVHLLPEGYRFMAQELLKTIQ